LQELLQYVFEEKGQFESDEPITPLSHLPLATAVDAQLVALGRARCFSTSIFTGIIFLSLSLTC